MASFRNDYGVLAHPKILEAICKYGSEENTPYGHDTHSRNAAKAIRKAFGCPKSTDVHILAGGTQTNMVVISGLLRPYEAVISCDSGHINVHETGAVEGQGTKVITVPAVDGKLNATQIETVVKRHIDEHMVLPKMVYISDSTETGTIYTKEELLQIRKACDKHGLYLYIDGARIGSALTCKACDHGPELIGQVADAFYVGGTKNGLPLGEALVINNDELKPHFRHLLKNKGAMLAKGYLLGIEFEEAFRNDLYWKLARHANEMAESLRNGLTELGLEPIPSPTNQVFLRLDKDRAEAIIAEFGCERWEVGEEEETIRFVTSFATDKEDLKRLFTFLQMI